MQAWTGGDPKLDIQWGSCTFGTCLPPGQHSHATWLRELPPVIGGSLGNIEGVNGGIATTIGVGTNGDIIFNDLYTFTTGNNLPTPFEIDLVTTAAHEMGHGLGVGHVDDQYSLMYPHLRGGQSRRSLTSHDIAAITQIYS